MRNKNTLRNGRILTPPFERRLWYRFVSTQEGGRWSQPRLVSAEVLQTREVAEGWHLVTPAAADIFVPGRIGGRTASAEPPRSPKPPAGELPERPKKRKISYTVFNNIFFDDLPEEMK